MGRKPESDVFGAVVLAGGGSARMGCDKAELRFHGVPLLAHMRALVAKAGANPILTGGGPKGELADPAPGMGPVASLCALADHTAGVAGMPERWIVVPVDMPLLAPGLLTRLADVPLVHAAHFDQEPLPLMLRMNEYTWGVMNRMKAKLMAGDSVALWRTLALLHAGVLAPTEAERRQLVNANTPEAWDHILAISEKA
jgi:molybdopterin-guanine dinucleotide biosynthesis protein A